MPYIPSDDRIRLLVEGKSASNSGELSYEIYSEIVRYIENKGLCWQVCSDVFGAIEGAKQEFQQNYAIPYEKTKKAENGDI
jgi:hypothetical protein